MAEGPLNTIRRWIRIIFDKPSADKAQKDMGDALAGAGKKGGENFVRELRAAFEKKMAGLKVQLAKGLIDPATFKRQGNAAARDFNAGIIAGMEKARIAGNITDTEYLKLARTLKKVGDDGEMSGRRVGSAWLKVGAAVSGFVAARFGLQQLARFFADSVRQAIEAEDSVSRLDSVLRPLGTTYRIVSGEVEGYLDRIQKTTRFSDGDAREALVNLVTATGDYGLSLRLLDLTAKIAEKRHTTMAAAAQTAADASKGLTKGMKDLGISTKETGDIVGKIDRNLGNLAEDGATKGSGAVARLNNLWDSFKEKIGLAIIGSEDFKGALGEQGLLGALKALNDWAEKHSSAISGFVDKLVWIGRNVGRISKEVLTFIPNPLMIAKGIDLLRGKVKGLFDDVKSGSSTTVEAARTETALTEEELERRKKIAAENAKTLLDLRSEVQRTELALVTEHQRQFEELTRKFWDRIKKLQGDALAEGIDLLAKAQANLLVKQSGILNEPAGPPRLKQDTSDVGLKAGSAIPPIQEMNRELFIQKSLLDAGAIAGTAFGDSITSLAEQQWDAAHGFADPWIDVLGAIEHEVYGKGSLFRELGEAWAEGGIVGVAKLAAAKVREQIAQAIEWAAKGLGMLVLGNPAGAAGAAKVAAGHFAAAAAWKTVAAVAGGAGGGGSTGASSFGGGGSPNFGRETQRPMQDLHVHFVGPGFRATNPEVIKVVRGTIQAIGERYNDSGVRVITHRDD